MDLFTLQVSEENLHPNFQRVYKSSMYQAQRELLSDWASEFIDRDKKFVKEFQTTFNSSFWELYLFKMFKENGCTIDTSHNTPDFLVQKNGCEIVVEATVSLAAYGSKNEWETDIESDLLNLDLNEFNRQAIIRLSNSITNKYRRYQNLYQNLGHVKGKPFVIALEPFHCPYHYLTADVPIRALLYDYYVNEQEFLDHPERYPDRHPPTTHLENIEKDNGSLIFLGLFNDRFVPEVSAIVFNHLATWGKLDALIETSPTSTNMLFKTVSLKDGQLDIQCSRKDKYKESIFAGLQIYHNPYANIPLPEDFFKHNDVSQCFGYMDEKHLYYDNYDGLRNRSVLNVVSSQ